VATKLKTVPIPTMAPTIVTIAPPRFHTATFALAGLSPLVVHKFSTKARTAMEETQKAGSTARKGTKREPKDFDAVFLAARHMSHEGWDGINASAFRLAMIDACRATGFKMTTAKQALFIEPDGLDAEDGTPLVRILGASPERDIRPARNDNGSMDIRVRPRWDSWSVSLRVTFDADMLSLADVTNLLARAGRQVGIGEGRPFSRNSAGLGWGTFTVEEKR
jgi:hypothetical protein